jgi:hypothetical protein
LSFRKRVVEGFPTIRELSGHPLKAFSCWAKLRKANVFKRNVLRKPSNQSSGWLSALFL